jgi:PPOX class probable F420-dependent enzyme
MTTDLPIPATLSDQARALLDAPEFATVATIDPDGQPQLSVIWLGRDGDDVLFSTIKGRRKTLNLQRDPRATVLMYPRHDPYTYLEVRGNVTMTDDPPGAFIDEMSRKYTGEDFAHHDPVEERIIVRLSPTTVVWHG